MDSHVCICLSFIIIHGIRGQTIGQHGEAVANQQFTMDCTITRPPNNLNALAWYRRDNRGGGLRIYSTRQCDAIIALSSSSPPGLTGGCDVINGKEVYSLTIANVTEDTENFMWRCFFGSSSTQFRVDVKVMVTSVTLQAPSSPLLAGSPSIFTCVTSPSKPSACVRWFIGNRDITTGQPVCNQNITSAQPTTQTQEVTAAAADNGANLYCTADNRVTNTTARSKDYSLVVEYPPSSNLTLSGYDGSALNSGTTVTLSCTVGEGNPQPTLTWSSVCGGNKVPGNDGRRPVSLTLTPSLNGKSCVCRGSQAGSRTGWSQDSSVTFNVVYPPEVQVIVNNMGEIREGTTLDMDCRAADGEPRNYTYTPWTHHIGDRRIELTTNTIGRRLRITNVQFQDQGVYTCGASNGVGGVQKGRTEIKIKGTPKFPFAETVVKTNLGGVITLSAGFVAFPAYTNITWYGVADGVEEIINLASMFGNKYRQRVREAVVDFTLYGTVVKVMGQEAELTIMNPDRRDVINYTLALDNEMGRTRHVFIASLKSADPSTDTLYQVPTCPDITTSTIVLAVVSSILLVVAVCEGAYIWRRLHIRKDKPKESPSPTWQPAVGQNAVRADDKNYQSLSPPNEERRNYENPGRALVYQNTEDGRSQGTDKPDAAYDTIKELISPPGGTSHIYENKEAQTAI